MNWEQRRRQDNRSSCVTSVHSHWDRERRFEGESRTESLATSVVFHMNYANGSLVEESQLLCLEHTRLAMTWYVSAALSLTSVRAFPHERDVDCQCMSRARQSVKVHLWERSTRMWSSCDWSPTSWILRHASQATMIIFIYTIEIDKHYDYRHHLVWKCPTILSFVSHMFAFWDCGSKTDFPVNSPVNSTLQELVKESVRVKSFILQKRGQSSLLLFFAQDHE